jgi:hypothetical protein
MPVGHLRQRQAWVTPSGLSSLVLESSLWAAESLSLLAVRMLPAVRTWLRRRGMVFRRRREHRRRGRCWKPVPWLARVRR